jgi:two-component system, OmpR family, response regulator RpaA
LIHPVPARRRPSESPAVIVIDDDADARRIYSEYLRAKGFTVFTAPDGRTGLTKTMELLPDVIVLDLAMPKVDGWTVLKQVRESSLTAPIPVVVLTAVTDVRDEAFYAGADAYLTKPCPPEVVYLQVKALARFH